MYRKQLLSLICVGSLVACLASAAGADELSRTTSWQRPDFDTVKTQAMELIVEQTKNEKVAAQAAEIWADLNRDSLATELLTAVTQTGKIADPRVTEVLDYCAKTAEDYHPPEYKWLREEGVPPMIAANLRLFYARWLAQHRYYDESLVQIADLNVEQVVDPATLLFLQGLNGHRLLNKEIGVKAFDELLKNEDDLPRRYVVLAGLMKSDLENMEDESLNHISRQMEDVERRLALGRAGKTVQFPEEETLDNLDKLIKKLEEQRKKQQQQQGGGSGDNIQSSSPAQDSTPMGGKGPGEIDRKNIGSKSGWGNLPPKEREKTLQDIGRDFPSHYRDAIEEFFREQAKLKRD